MMRARAAAVVALVTIVAACASSTTKSPPPPPPKPVAKASASAAEEPVPPHLQHFPGLFVRKGAEIVDAPAEDIEVAKAYPRSKDKGPLIDGHRITLLTKKRSYRVGEEVRVLHVHEIPGDGENIYPMGPKPIRGEVVNGKLVTPSVVADVDPFIPAVYDGAVVPSPAVDYNWEITTYRFSASGTRTIQWKLGKYASNILTVEITP